VRLQRLTTTFVFKHFLASFPLFLYFLARLQISASERAFPNFLALRGQTAPGRVTVTRCRSEVCPWPENDNLPLLLNASYSPWGYIYGLPTRPCELSDYVGVADHTP